MGGIFTNYILYGSVNFAGVKLFFITLILGLVIWFARYRKMYRRK